MINDIDGLTRSVMLFLIPLFVLISTGHPPICSLTGRTSFRTLYSIDEEYPLCVSKSGYHVLLYFKIPEDSTSGKTRLESTFGSESGFQQVDIPFATKQCLPDPKRQFTEHSSPSDDYRKLDDEYE